MGYVTETMGKAITLSRVLAWASITIGFGILILTLIGVPWRNQPDGIWVILAPVLFYILPGLLLHLFAWRMEKMDLWAYLATTLLSGALIFKYVVLLVANHTAGQPVYSPALIFEPFLRAPSIYLIVVCINSLPNVSDEFRNRQRARRESRRGFEPIMATPPLPAKLPPRPNLIRPTAKR